MRNYTKVKNQLIVSDMKDSEFRILVYLIARTKDGKCFPSMRTMAKELPSSKETIRKCVDSLIKKNIIQRENRVIGTGKKTSNLYTISKDYLVPDTVDEILNKPQSKPKELYDYDWLSDNEEEV